jgi:hypothetical protein
MRRTMLVGLVCVLVQPIVALAQPSFVIGQDFLGSSLTNGSALNGGGLYAPPDSDGTIGPNHFIEFVNGVFAVFNKTGNPTNGAAGTPITRISDSSFWNGVTNDGSYAGFTGLSDTHVRYDPNSNRYYAVEITTAATQNKVLIARTNAGADPSVLSNWRATSFQAATGFGDYPMLGFDANAVYVSTNNFTSSSGGFSNVGLTSIPKSDLNLATPTVANRTSVTRGATNSASDSGFTPQPVIDWAPSKGAGVFIGTTTGGSLVVTKPTGTGAPLATYGNSTSATIGAYTGPMNASQPDGTRQIDASDGRQVNAAYQVGNDIWGVQAIRNTGGTNTRAYLRWYHLDNSTNSLVASGTIGDAAGNYDYFNASIAANANGVIVLSFTRSGSVSALGTSTSGAAGDYVVVGGTVGSTTTFGTPLQLQDGFANNYHLFGGTGERWGDLSQVSVDPNDTNTFWLINEFAQVGGTGGASRWADNITQLTVVPEPATFVLSASAAALLVFRKRRRTAM